MTDYFLSPHSDDEALFGAYTLLMHHPIVVQTLRCDLRKAPWEVRAAEAVAGAAVLGCEVIQWDILESDPDEDAMVAKMRALPDPGRVWSPAPYEGGHPHHNLVGECAIEVFKTPLLYATYALNPTTGVNEKMVGDPVASEWGWAELKRQALDCYVSQHHNRSTFLWPLEEYLAT